MINEKILQQYIRRPPAVRELLGLEKRASVFSWTAGGEDGSGRRSAPGDESTGRRLLGGDVASSFCSRRPPRREAVNNGVQVRCTWQQLTQDTLLHEIPKFDNSSLSKAKLKFTDFLRTFHH